MVACKAAMVLPDAGQGLHYRGYDTPGHSTCHDSTANSAADTSANNTAATIRLQRQLSGGHMVHHTEAVVLPASRQGLCSRVAPRDSTAFRLQLWGRGHLAGRQENVLLPEVRQRVPGCTHVAARTYDLALRLCGRIRELGDRLGTGEEGVVLQKRREGMPDSRAKRVLSSFHQRRIPSTDARLLMPRHHFARTGAIANATCV